MTKGRCGKFTPSSGRDGSKFTELVSVDFCAYMFIYQEHLRGAKWMVKGAH